MFGNNVVGARIYSAGAEPDGKIGNIFTNPQAQAVNVIRFRMCNFATWAISTPQVRAGLIDVASNRLLSVSAIRTFPYPVGTETPQWEDFLIPETVVPAGEIAIVIWVGGYGAIQFSCANGFGIPQISMSEEINNPTAALGTLDNWFRYDLYADSTTNPLPPENPPEPPVVVMPPIPPAMPSKVMNNANEVWSTDFKNAAFTYFPYRLENIGGMYNYVMGVETGGGTATLHSFEDGQRALRLLWMNHNTDRIGLVLWGREPSAIGTKKWVGKEFLYEAMIYLPSDFVLTSPTDTWLGINQIEDAVSYSPKSQLGFVGSIAHPEIPAGTFDMFVDRWYYGMGIYKHLQTVKNYPPPTGRWVKMSWYQKFDAVNGAIKVWLDNVPVFDIQGLNTLDNPSNLDAAFSFTPAKLYCNTDESLPKEIWVTNVKLYDVISETPSTITLNVQAGTGGSVFPNGTNVLILGQGYQFLETPSAGYIFDHWDLNGVSQGSVNPLTLTADASMNGQTLTAVFTPTGTPPHQPTVAARSIGPLGVPSALLHQLWRLRERFIRPEVHRKLHPLV